MIWQIGVLLVGIGILLASLFLGFILLNLTRSLRTIEAILSVTLDEARLALPELRHSLQQIDDMVSGVNDKFSAADRAMNATGAAITGFRERIRQRLEGLGRRPGAAAGHDQEAK
ncbi:MAG: hypothetical protein M3Z11_04815 [Candidatus Dormibacteraeota bacterium]|nr:hypothetical protein [Candidatus Dormibacteraeota bacterium]